MSAFDSMSSWVAEVERQQAAIDALESSPFMRAVRDMEASATFQAQHIASFTASAHLVQTALDKIVAAESELDLLAAHAAIAPPRGKYYCPPRAYVPAFDHLVFREPEPEPTNRRSIVRKEVKTRIGFV